MTSPLRLRLLGPLEAVRAGDRLDLGPPKQRAVLACLVLAAGRTVSVERLLDAVWGEQLPASAVGGLQVYVSHLRRLLGGVSTLERVGSGYRLDVTGVAVDVVEAAGLVMTLRAHLASRAWRDAGDVARRLQELDRGPLLADLEETPWLREQREAWRAQLAEARAGQVVALLGDGQVEEAVSRVGAATVAEPLRDDLVRLHALALARAGRPTQALDVLAAHARALDDELGLEPGPELRDLQVALLRHDAWTRTWPLAPGEPVEAPAPSVTSGSEGAPGPREGVVGRGDELAVVDALVADVVSGRPRVLLLTGPAGIGKTRLADVALDEVVRRGGRAGRSHSTEQAGAPAWWPVRQVLRDLGDDPDVVLAGGDTVDADTARFVVQERLRERLEEHASRAPVAVLVDDLQWADPVSAAGVAHAAATVSGGVLLVVTVRDGEGGPDLPRTLQTLLRSPGARHLALPPLDVDAVAELAGRIRGEDVGAAEVGDLMSTTGGNALFVAEYARLPREQRSSVPLAVRGVLARRVASLEGPALDTLRVAAVLGDPVDVDLLVRVTGASYDAVLDALDRASAEHVIEVSGRADGFAFTHALLRDEVQAGLSLVRRQQVHLRAGDALATEGRDRLTARAGHLVAAGPLADPRELLEACRAAALQAEERSSPETAVPWWERASDAAARLPDDDRDPAERDDLIVARIDALVRAGRGQTALDEVDRELLAAARERRTATVGRLAATLLRSAGTWPWVAGGQDPGPVLARLHAAEPVVTGDHAAHVRVLAALAVGHCYDLDAAVPDTFSRRALALAETLDDPDVLADALVGRVLTYVGEALHAVELEDHLARLLALPHRDRHADVALAHSAMTMSRFALADLSGVEHHLALAVSAADLQRLPAVRAQCRWMALGVAHWRTGPERAMELHAEASAGHLSTELYEGGGFANSTFHALLWDLGRLRESETYDGYEPVTWSAAVAAAHGRRDEAVDLLRRRLADPAPAVWSTLGHLAVIAHVVADLADLELAAVALDRLAPYAGMLAGFGQGPTAGPADLARARLLALLDRVDEARVAASAALDLCVREGGTVWADRTRSFLDSLG